MTEERRLIMAGIPLEDAISLCYSMRREGTLPEFVKNEEIRHVKSECCGKCEACVCEV